MKKKPTAVPAVPAASLAVILNAEAARFRQHGLELAGTHLFKPDPQTERLARDHFIRAETYRAAAKLAAGN